ncbi:MAG: hypothetical protein ACWGMZ_02340, partial [Thermoguttaceae bacterium]
VGEKVTVNFPGTAETAKGSVEFVSPITDPESSTVRMKVVLENAKGQYRSGMACFLTILSRLPHSLDADNYSINEQ